MHLNHSAKIFLTVLVAAWLLLTAGVSLLVIVFGHWDGPWRDMWDVTPWLHAAYTKSFLWQDLWTEYGNSHRFYIARLIWLADWTLSGANNHLIICISLICQLGIFLCFFKQFRLIELNYSELFLCTCLLIFYLVNPSQIFNYLYTFDVQWFFVTLCTVVSCFLLSKNDKQYLRLAVVFLLIVIAGGNNFSGLVVLPILFLLMMLSGYSRLSLSLYVAAVSVFLFFYVQGLSAVSGSVFAMAASVEGISFWQYVIGFFIVFIGFPLAYLASPFSYLLRPGEGAEWQGMLLAALPMIIVAAVVVVIMARLLLRRKNLSMIERFAGAVFIFCLAVALVTSFGRAWFFEMAYAERFQNIVLLFWMSVSLLLIYWWRRIGLILMMVLALLFHGLPTLQQLNSIVITINRTANANAAIYTGIVDKLNVLQATISRYNFYETDVPYSMAAPVAQLKDTSLAMFQQRDWQAPTLSERVSAKLCEYHFTIDKQATAQKGQALYIEGVESVARDGVWFVYRNDELKVLLLPRRSDYAITWLYEVFNPSGYYQGFTEDLDLLQSQILLKFYKKTENGFCLYELKSS